MRTATGRVWQVIGALWAVGFVSPAGAASAPEVRGRPASRPTTQPSAGVPIEPRYPHPKDVPDGVLRARVPQAIILPSEPPEPGVPPELRSGGAIGEPGRVEKLLPEGYVVARRPGRFAREDPWWTVSLAEVAGLPSASPLRVLPNRRLMLLERVLKESGADESLLVTGRVTEFLGRNYILLEDIATPPRTASSASRGAGPGQGTRPTGPPTAAQIIEQLSQEAPPRPAAAVTRTQPAAASGPAAAPDEGRTQPEGTILPEFPVRLVRAEWWWVAVRESQGSRPVAESYPVLPSRLLEVMVSASAGGTVGTVFLVSGELTEYRGGNYLLVHKVLIRRDLGNVR